jgi:trimeric autotransporter adhesin
MRSDRHFLFCPRALLVFGAAAFVPIVSNAQRLETYQELKIGATHVMPALNQWNTIPGGYGNEIRSGWNNAIGGGWTNWIDGYYGTVAGGRGNANFSWASGAIGGGSYNVIDTSSDTTLVGRESYNGVIGGGDGNRTAGWYTTISGGHTNLIRLATTFGNGQSIPTSPPQGGNQRNSNLSTIAGGESNIISSSIASTISGGLHNVMDGWVNFSVISGGHDNWMSYGSGYSTISGGTENRIVQGAWWGAINGGFQNQVVGPLSNTNTVWTGQDLAHFGWIGGGRSNIVFGVAGSIGGGATNLVEGNHGTIAGGYENTIDTGARGGTITGGEENEIGQNAIDAFIGGGTNNVINSSATCATIPGGYVNLAAGTNSFAGGTKAYAQHNGSFVWADASSTTQFPSLAANQFRIRAYGGLRVDTSATSASGVAAGSAAWSNMSAKNSKENFKPVDVQNVLQHVAALPVTTWNYKSQDRAIRHLGPTAEDFKIAFELGENEESISTVDSDGVALASIQALYQMLREKDKRLEAQEAQVKALEVRLAELERKTN